MARTIPGSAPKDASAVSGAGGQREAILDAATAVFARYGFRKTSMDDIARAVGLSRQGVYLHFDNKEALFQAGVLRVIELSRQAARDALRRADLEIEARLLGAFEASHADAIGESAALMSELLETAKSMVGPAMAELEAEFVADIARELESTGIAAGWKQAEVSARELAEHLHVTSLGLKHVVPTVADYRDRMRVALRIVCRGGR